MGAHRIRVGPAVEQSIGQYDRSTKISICDSSSRTAWFGMGACSRCGFPMFLPARGGNCLCFHSIDEHGSVPRLLATGERQQGAEGVC